MRSASPQWFKLVPLYSESHLAIRGDELDGGDARYLVQEPRPLTESYFDRFDWVVSIDQSSRDLIGNNLGWIVMSDRAKEALEHLTGLAVNFVRLPDYVMNGAEHRCQAWLFHPLVAERVLNITRSEVRVSNLGGKSYISAINRLVIDPRVLRSDSCVFRLQEFPSIIIVSNRFRLAWRKARCTGLHFEIVMDGNG